jgi:hypothetical protein
LLRELAGFCICSAVRPMKRFAESTKMAP